MLRSRFLLWGAAVASALGLGALSTANAATYTDYLSGTFTSPSPVTAPHTTPDTATGGGERFETGASAPTLSDLVFEVSSSLNNSSDSIVVTLYTNSSSAPGTLITTLATIPLSTIFSSFGSGNVGAVNLENVQSLLPGGKLSTLTDYWIGFDTVGLNSATYSDVKLAITSTGIGSNLQALAYNTNLVGGGDFFDVCASSDASCAAAIPGSLSVYTQQAPEPATLAVLGSALTGLGLLRRRRAKRDTSA